MTDLLLRNARIWTQDPALPWAEAAFIRDGRFAFAGREPELSVPAGTPVVDARGGLVLPGFCDSHAHLMSTGFARQQLRLKDVVSVTEVQRLVRDRARALPPGTWIQGGGWDQNLWPGARFPTRTDLDAAAPDHPVFLTHTSAHCAWVNSVALRIAGVDALTEAPNGGQVDRDASGEPTGILRDNAIDLVRRHIPRPGPVERRDALREAISHALAHGLTAVHAMDVGASELDAIEALDAEGALALRVRAFLTARDLQRWEGRRTGNGTDMLAIGGVKFFADGALGSVTAWMTEPYENTAETGFPLQPVDELEAGVRWCLEHGLAPAIHAIGDRANAEVVSILERLRDLAPDLPRRIEHAQLLRAGLPERMAALGLTASVQPIHATQDMDKVDRRWGSRGRWAYPFATLRAAGVNLAFGSDTPVETLDPIAGIRAAVARQRPDGTPPGGWYPAERISAADAIAAYTAGPAIAVREEHRLGRIAPGYLADAVILTGNILESPPESLRDTRVLATIAAGRLAYHADP